MNLQTLIDELNKIEDKEQEVIVGHEDNELILTLWDNTKECQAHAVIQKPKAKKSVKKAKEQH